MDEKKTTVPESGETRRRAYTPPELKKFAPIKKATGYYIYYYYYSS